jgi:hypothetical protein
VSLIAIREGGTHLPSALEEGPMGGAESAVIELARALARRGHEVVVRTDADTVEASDNLTWGAVKLPANADIAIANRALRFVDELPRSSRKALWLHNTAEYLLRPRTFAQLMRRRPTLVFIGSYHRRQWAPLKLLPQRTIPYGLSAMFLNVTIRSAPPPPKAIFTSNPLRGLDWLLERWTAIHEALPSAELHIFSGPQTYGAWGQSVSGRMEPVLERARSMERSGVVTRVPVARGELVCELTNSRAMLYRGDRAETFCLAVAEAQAVGVPGVVQPLGSMSERVAHGLTGFVEDQDDAYVARAVQLLTDDTIWRSMSAEAAQRARRSWDDAADDWESQLE